MDIHGLSNDFVEIIARLVLYKNMRAEGVKYPITDHWLERYNGKSLNPESKLKYPASLEYNMFRTEVDATVSQLMHTTQNRLDGDLDYQTAKLWEQNRAVNMKCNNCKYQRIEGSMGTPTAEVYCSKGHWDGLPYALASQEPIFKDPWDDCKDFQVEEQNR